MPSKFTAIVVLAACCATSALAKDQTQQQDFAPNAVIPQGTKFHLVGPRSGKLCQDNEGGLKEKAGPWETFTVDDAQGSTVWLRSGFHNNLCADLGNGVSCDRKDKGDWEKFQLEPLGGNKVAIRGRAPLYKYCTEKPDGKLVCDSDERTETETFTLYKAK